MRQRLSEALVKSIRLHERLAELLRDCPKKTRLLAGDVMKLQNAALRHLLDLKDIE